MRLVALGSSFAAGPGIPPVVDRPQRPRRLTRPLLRLVPQLDGLPAHALPPQLRGHGGRRRRDRGDAGVVRPMADTDLAHLELALAPTRAAR
ncbi:hypothetical protein [Nocardioides sp. KR10-350]|uniref:hypothetical protein n=1 Tax=Nocardioides cheoyonin TaxID=3156615 RepID=UPI0032B50111